MTHLIDELEAVGLVERQADPADRRARRVVLTASGRRTWDEASSRLSVVERDFLAPLNETQRLTLTEALARLAVPGACEAAGDAEGACTVPDPVEPAAAELVPTESVH